VLHDCVKRIARGAGFAFAALIAATAGAQGFPDRPILVLLPFAAGGLLDTTVRAVTQPMQQALGQPVVVESRPGGATFIAMQACAKAPPDGHTLCVTTPDSLSYNPYLFSKLPYDPEKDFVPVTNLVLTNNLIVAHSDAPFSTFKDMIAYAKTNPGKVTWGTWGPGSIPHVYLETITRHYAVDILGIPYRGAGQATPAILAGQIHATYGGAGFYMPHIEAGKLKPLAATPEASLPGVPTMKELGVEPGLPSYFGVYAPASTPAPVVERLAAEFAKALQTPKVQEFLKAQTLRPVGSSPAEFAAFVRADRANAERTFRSMGLKPLDAQ
jgi:tripartite-type tricarboxylate transporter receptor subunit TctC